MVEDSIIAFAIADAPILAEIDNRFYSDKVPDKSAHPFAKLSQVDDDQLHSHDGDSGHIGLWQIEIYDTSKEDCNDLAELFFTRFDSHSGAMGDVTVGYVFATNKFGEWSPDGRHFRRVLELRIGTNDR